MTRKRTSRREAEHLSEQRKALAVRYTIDSAEAQRREQLAAEAAETDERSSRAALVELEGGAVKHGERVTEQQSHLASRPDPPHADKDPVASQRPAALPHAYLSARSRYVLLLGSTATAAAFYAAGWQSPVRVAVTVVFLLFLPGLALAELAPLADAAERLAVGVGASLALESLVAVVFLYAGFFTPGRVFAVSLVATAGFTAVAAFRARQPA
jgi:hypothetical protein